MMLIPQDDICAARYDPTQMAEWQQFRNQTIGDSEMLSCQNKVGADPEQPPRMRLNSDAFF